MYGGCPVENVGHLCTYDTRQWTVGHRGTYDDRPGQSGTGVLRAARYVANPAGTVGHLGT